MKEVQELLKINKRYRLLKRRRDALLAVIREVLEAGKEAKYKSNEVRLVPMNRRTIDTTTFINTFDAETFLRVAKVDVSKVDALVKLGELDAKSVDSITETIEGARLQVRETHE